MKKKLLRIMLLIVSCFTLLGCTTDNKNKEEILDGATMTIKDGTLTKTGATVIIIDTNKEEEHTYGDSFRIDKKESDKWENLKPIIENYGFNAIGYKVDDNNELEMEINWKWLYGELESGEYRLVKDAAINKNNSYLGSGVVYTEFTIE